MATLKSPMPVRTRCLLVPLQVDRASAAVGQDPVIRQLAGDPVDGRQQCREDEVCDWQEGDVQVPPALSGRAGRRLQVEDSAGRSRTAAPHSK